MCCVSAENTPDLPHKVVSDVETPHVEALSCSLCSVLLTIFKWDVVWKCCFAGSSTESTVRQLSRKIIFGSRKKNKLAKECSFQVVSGSLVTRFNSVVAHLDPVEKWEGFHAGPNQWSGVWRGSLYWIEGDFFHHYLQPSKWRLAVPREWMIIVWHWEFAQSAFQDESPS